MVLIWLCLRALSMVCWGRTELVKLPRFASLRRCCALTTPYLEEADQLAERIAVMDHGKIIAEGTSGELKPRPARVFCR